MSGKLGVLERSINVFTEDLVDMDQERPTGKRFAAQVNAKLDISRRKDVYIYVHGYKVVFENPLLVASELWHFLGYEGVFIAFAWPSTPSTLAYFSDLETAALSAGNLRLLIQYLAEQTDVERIHLIGYSVGTRLVTEALHQLASMHAGASGKDSAKSARIGHVILTGSDVDTHLFGSYVVDGMLNVVGDITIYASAKDSALGVSEWVFGRQRVGQISDEAFSSAAVSFLQTNEKLVIVNASDAPGADTGNGHAYFRQSPWTSSDILSVADVRSQAGTAGAGARGRSNPLDVSGGLHRKAAVGAVRGPIQAEGDTLDIEATMRRSMSPSVPSSLSRPSI